MSEINNCYNTWFGEVCLEDGLKVFRSKNLKESFQSCKNWKLPFSVKDAGMIAFGSESEYYRNLRRTALQVAEERVRKELQSDERYLISLLKALDEIDLGINLFSEKIRDIEETRESSLTEKFNQIVSDLKTFRKDLENEINSHAERIIPNVSSIAGGVIAARLLEKAGSLKKLASMPASTIQIIGAEKSLFKAISRMKKGKKAKTPKHGIIFQHPYIRGLPKKKRGKMARFMAAKLAIAARIDFYGGELNEELVEMVRKKYGELQER
jgi:nucleolar protein 56